MNYPTYCQFVAMDSENQYKVICEARMEYIRQELRNREFGENNHECERKFTIYDALSLLIKNGVKFEIDERAGVIIFKEEL